MITLTIVQKIAVWSIPVILAVTMHEASHAWVANRCGDNTAKMLGRLSLNPIRHIDPIGTLLMPILIAVLSQFQFIFGWAKPVPIHWPNLRNPRRDMGLVALAGPFSNLIMAVLWSICLKTVTMFSPVTSSPMLFLLLAAQAGILINLILAFLNLLPIPPLDGSRILASLLPPNLAEQYLKLERWGWILLIALLFSGSLSLFLNPVLNWTLTALQTVFHL